jgi:histone deacetylase 1/2
VGGSSSNSNQHQQSCGRNDGGRGGFRRDGGGRRNGNDGGGGRNFLQGVFCQLYGKEGHTVVRCFKRFDANFTGPPQKSVSSASTTSYGVDSNWYVDSSATDHITSDLEKLSFRDKYHGDEQVLSANGAGMQINHIGYSTLQSPVRDVHLNNVLHVPSAHKNLVSAHRLVKDNNAFLELHPHHFSLKEQVTRKTLLEGRCECGLYPLKSHPQSPSPPNKQALGVHKASTSLWHSRLGHASSPVVHKILSHHKISSSSDLSSGVICDACQMGKSHQLPYPKSTSVSSKPFELVFSDVWGPAPTSVGRHSYYVSFVDDFSKFTWIYLLRFKSEVFQCFRDFQNMVERQFDHKILAVQSDWGGRISNPQYLLQTSWHCSPCVMSSCPSTKWIC